jgi:hypothetical protein
VVLKRGSLKFKEKDAMAYSNDDRRDVVMVHVLRFVGSTQNSNLLFTPAQWGQFLEALPGLQVLLGENGCDDHREIKGNGLIVEHTIDSICFAANLAEGISGPAADVGWTQDVRVFESIHRAIITKYGYVQSTPDTDDTDERSKNGQKWLRYLCGKTWTQALVSLVNAQEDVAFAKFEYLMRNLFAGIRNSLGNMPSTTGENLTSIHRGYPGHIFNHIVHFALSQPFCSENPLSELDYSVLLQTLRVMSSSINLHDILNRTIECVWLTLQNGSAAAVFTEMPPLADMQNHPHWLPGLLERWKWERGPEFAWNTVNPVLREKQTRLIELFELWLAL